MKYDTEAMRNSAQSYRDTAKKLKTVKEELKQHITDLKNEHWRTSAGEAFLNLYEDSWATNIDKYSAVMEEMAVQLDSAADKYDTVTDKLKEIEGISIDS